MPLDFTRSWSNEELDLLRETTARFLDAEVVPDDAPARQRGYVDRQLWNKAGALGLLCIDIPEEYGGGGGDFRHEAVVHDEMGLRGLTGMNIGVHSITAHYIFNHGTEEQKKKYLPKMASGELVGAIAMTEPGAGSDLQGVRTRAEKQADGSYLINGSKTFITNGFLAGLIVVVCKTDPDQGARGTSLLIVETENCPGFKVGRLLDKVGMRSQDTSELFFDDVRVPGDALLGGIEGQGFFQLMSDLPYERTLLAVGALGSMEGAYQATLAYVRERKAFGQPVAQFQNTRFQLAEVATEITVGRAFVDRCVERLAAGTLDTATASMAKLWASEAQGRVVDKCLQLFGGYGYMNEYLIARMYADARIQRIYGGTNEIMKELISRHL